MKKQTHIRRNRGAAGFTLIELMVVVAIIGMLAVIVGLRLSSSVDEASQQTARAQITNLKAALMMFKLKHKKFPQSLDELVNPPSGESFLDGDRVPLDPWNNAYVYRIEGSSDYEIICLGADGVPGGSEYDSDISSKNLQGN